MEDDDWGNSDFPAVVTEIVRQQLYELHVHKSTRPDGIDPRVLKELANVSWTTLKWKPANSILIYKKGKRENPGNYRPINLTSVRKISALRAAKTDLLVRWLMPHALTFG